MQTPYRASLTSEIVRSSLQKNIHCPDMFSKILLGGRQNAKGKKKKKQPTSLHFTTAKGISKTFLHSYNVLFRYVIS